MTLAVRYRQSSAVRIRGGARGPWCDRGLLSGLLFAAGPTASNWPANEAGSQAN